MDYIPLEGRIFTCGHALHVVYEFSNGPTILGCRTCDVGSHVAAKNSLRVTAQERAAWARVEG